MRLSLTSDELLHFIDKQSYHFFPDKYRLTGNDVSSAFDLGLERMEHCIKHITLPGYHDGQGNPYFSHMHGDQYSQFLFFFSNSLWKTSQNKPLCDKLLFLNRALMGMFFSYKGGLPDIFVLGHPVGTVLGNAAYSDFLVVFQNVTVNTNCDENGNVAPKLGKGLFLGTGCKVIGNKNIGDRVSIGVDALVYNQNVPDDSVVMCGKNGETLVKPRKKETCMAQNYFNVDIV